MNEKQLKATPWAFGEGGPVDIAETKELSFPAWRVLGFLCRKQQGSEHIKWLRISEAKKPNKISAGSRTWAWG